MDHAHAFAPEANAAVDAAVDQAAFDRYAHQRRIDALLGVRRDESGAPIITGPVVGEGQAHAELKALIAKAALAAGWMPSFEVAGDGWRADVLLERGDQRVAFEVQLAPQNIATYKERQRRYRKAGIPCFWFVGGYPDGYVPEARVPLFRVRWPREDAGATGPHVGLPERQRFTHRRRSEDTNALPLADAVRLLLDSGLRFVTTASITRHVELIGWQEPCWRCKTGEGSAWGIAHLARTICGLPCDSHSMPTAESGIFAAKELDLPAAYANVLAPGVREMARRAGLSDRAVKMRRSRTMNSSYESFGCESCDAIFGAWFLRDTFLELVYDPPIHAFEAIPGTFPLERPHWCVVNADGCHCDSIV